MLPDESAESVAVPEGLVAVLPIRDDGTESTWGAIPSTTKKLLENGYLRVGSFDEKTKDGVFNMFVKETKSELRQVKFVLKERQMTDH